jgi:cyanophycinase-like exopeptidase
MLLGRGIGRASQRQLSLGLDENTCIVIVDDISCVKLGRSPTFDLALVDDRNCEFSLCWGGGTNLGSNLPS